MKQNLRRALPFLLTLWPMLAAGQILPLPEEKKGWEAVQREDFANCAPVSQRAVAARGNMDAPIGAAECYAIAGDERQVARYVRMALQRGYHNCEFLARFHSFANMRARPDWRSYELACEENEARYIQSANAEIFVAFLEAMEDHGLHGTYALQLAHDGKRTRLVHLALAGHFLRTAADYFHAANIMELGSWTPAISPGDLALARDLAKRASELDPYDVQTRWLYATLTDSFLLSSGKPQIFGTTYRNVNGLTTLEPFNPNGVTDKERARWCVLSLAERLAEVRRMNADRKPAP